MGLRFDGPPVWESDQRKDHFTMLGFVLRFGGGPHTALLIFLLTTAATCEKVPDPIIPEDTASCADACLRLAELGCEEGKPLADGTTCTQFCESTQESGFPLNPSCVKNIPACVEIDTCVGHGLD
jgi:hypothetical protein